MNQPPSRWKMSNTSLYGPNTFLYKTSANFIDTKNFITTFSPSKYLFTFSTLVSMALLFLLLLHIPETQKKKKTFVHNSNTLSHVT